jgi:hypothetical protein
VHAVAVGVACLAIAIALVARRRAAARWLYVPLALWLFASQWIIHLPAPLRGVEQRRARDGAALLPPASWAFGEPPGAAHDA